MVLFLIHLLLNTAINTVNVQLCFRHTTKQAMLSDIQDMKYKGGGTNTDVCLRFVTQSFLTSSRGDRPDKPNICVILTDGSSSNHKRTAEAAANLKKKCHVIVIQVGSWVNKAEIYGKSNYFFSSRFAFKLHWTC